MLFTNLRRPGVILLFVVTIILSALMLTSCSRWDSPENSEVNRDLRESLSAAGALPDPRALQGVSTVSGFSDPEPISSHVNPALPVELVDADGHDVTVTDTSRILALDLYGAYTRTLIGLGLADSIVGRTVSSTEYVLEDLPVVTRGGHELNVEAVLQLHPTLVIVDHSIGPRDAIDQIRSAGVPIVVLEPERSITSVGEDIRQVASVVGLPEEGEKLAERSMADIEAATRAIADISPENPLRMAFLYARGSGGVFFLLGESVGTRGLIEGIGGTDAVTAAGILETAPANAEALAKLDPDVFVMMSGGLESAGGLEGLLQRPGVAQTTAGQKGRILVLPDGLSLSFGPQTGEVLLRSALALYGRESGE